MAGTDQAAASPGGATPPPAPVANGADTGGKSYVVDDARSAGDAIAGLLFGADDEGKEPAAPPQADDKSPPPPEADDAGADESQPTGEEDDKGEGEPPPKAAAIDPPASWSAEDKQAFSQLPPALQQTVARRESQREAALTQRSQEAAEAKRAFEGERQAAVAQRVEYLQGLQKMLTLAAPDAAALENIDWMAVQAQSPAEYTRLQALRDNMRSRLGAIEQHYQQQQQQLSALQAQQLAEHVAREHVQLNQRWPDYGDEVKGPQLRKELSTYLADTFSQEELGKAYDHRLVVLATKAMLYDRQQSLAASADTKRNNAAPQVRAPGNSQGSDRGPAQRLQARVNQLGRTNSVRDAGSLIAELLT